MVLSAMGLSSLDMVGRRSFRLRTIQLLGFAVVFASVGPLSLLAQEKAVLPVQAAATVSESKPSDSAILNLATPDSVPELPAVSSSITQFSELPDAPEPQVAVAALEPVAFPITEPAPEAFSFKATTVPGFDPFKRAVSVQDCPYVKGNDPHCHVHWGQFAIEGSLYLAFQNAGNLYTGYFYRYETLTGKWWDRYVNSVEGWRWTRWTDQNPFLDDYIGHSMQGAITDMIWIQNDPKSMTVKQANDWIYYRSRLRALAFSTFFSFEWKLGPIGEASIGHNGDHYFSEKGELTNETGWVELVSTPVGGIIWTAGEDYLDRTLVPKLERKPHGPLALMGISMLTPVKTTANILRFRAPWYRDARVVRANSFFSDPADDQESSPDADLVGSREGDSLVAPTSIRSYDVSHNLPVIGGKHEFGVLWGMSVSSQGPAGDVKYMPIVVRYSYLLHQGAGWAFRYAPEGTALSMVDFASPLPPSVDMSALLQRTRSYGAGVSPIGVQLDFLTSHRLQPFLSTNEGAIYYQEPTLVPNTGPRLLYTSDVGGGVNIFRKRRQAISLGYRYQHLAGGPSSVAGASTDANTFFVGVSRFATSHVDDGRVQ